MNDTEPKAKEKLKGQKYLGGVWESDSRFGLCLKQRFRVEEVEWMLEKAKGDGKGYVDIWTWKKGRKMRGRYGCTHITFCWVSEGEAMWDAKFARKRDMVDEGEDPFKEE
jgi:hypothetical protein